MPSKGEAMIIPDMPTMTQFVYDLYNTKLDAAKKQMAVRDLTLLGLNKKVAIQITSARNVYIARHLCASSF